MSECYIVVAVPLKAPAFRLEVDADKELASEYDNMLACIRCGACLTSCPTYVISMHESEGPRGRIGIMRALAEGHLEVTPDLVQHELNCLVCDACSAVCPAGVHMDPMQVALRSVIEQRAQRPWWQRLVRRFAFGWAFRDMRNFRLLVRLLWLAQTLRLTALGHVLPGLSGPTRLLPKLSGRFLIPRGETYAAAGVDGPRNAERGSRNPEPRVDFFAGCVMSTALAEIDRATIRVLQRAGCTIRNPAGQGCCGALNAHSGDIDGALALARRTIAAFEGSSAPVVVNSAGCGAMLKDYAHHLRHDPAWAERARAFSARVRDLSEVLADLRLPLTRSPGSRRVVYQDACHLLHAQRISRQPRALLRQVPGAELVEIAEAGLCCGSAGVYNLTNPEPASNLQARKVDNILAAQPGLVVTGNPGCLLQLRAGLAEKNSPVQVRHLAEVLDEATRP
jgi:glycolate oxidase iron-sulfur subunit